MSEEYTIKKRQIDNIIEVLQLLIINLESFITEFHKLMELEQ